jgi:hypothetical protein
MLRIFMLVSVWIVNESYHSSVCAMKADLTG